MQTESAMSLELSLLQELGAPRNLERERASTTFQEYCHQHFDTLPIQKIAKKMEEMMDSKAWEERYGGLKLAEIVLTELSQKPKIENERQREGQETIITGLLDRSTILMQDKEFRVRKALGPALGSLARVDGALVLSNMRKPLVQNIKENLERSPEADEKAPGSVRYSHEAKGDLMHDTEGWRSLDTSVGTFAQILSEAVFSSPQEAEATVDEEMVGLIEVLAQHTNRFVREITFLLIEAVFTMASKKNEHALLEEKQLARMVKIVSEGLADNWSQVRMAASKSVRAYFVLQGSYSPEQESKSDGASVEKGPYASVLLPRVCLNRRYVAEGVRVHASQTWKRIVLGRGKKVVASLASDFATYYISQSRADNHAVREAACHCISEVCEEVCKEDRKAFEEHVDSLLGALIDCFKDASWPVRDSACIACSHFVAAFPEESQPRLEQLFDLWKKHLSDNIRSVREHSAQSLSLVANALGSTTLERVAGLIDQLLPSYRKQASDSKKFSQLETVTQFGVAGPKSDKEESKEEHHHHDHNGHGTGDEHENQQMYSCGSLAPKLKRGGGCMDHGFSRAKEPWEETEGAVFLIASLANQHFPMIEKHFQTLELLTTIDTFKHAKELRETVFRTLTHIVRNLPRARKFTKQQLTTLSSEEQTTLKAKIQWRSNFSGLYLEGLLEQTFRSLSKGPQTVGFAASEFLEALSQTYGYIVKATIERTFPQYLEDYSRCLEGLAQMPTTGSHDVALNGSTSLA